MANYDILTDIDNATTPFSLLFSGGDFVVDVVDEQNIRLALLSSKGNWKQYPLVGAGLFKMLHLTARTNYKQIVTNELARIGYKVTRFEGGSAGFDSILDFDLDVEEM